MSDDRESDLLRQRRANFEELVRLGIDPYPRKFERTEHHRGARRRRTASERERSSRPTRSRRARPAGFWRSAASARRTSSSSPTAPRRSRSTSARTRCRERDFAIFKLLDFGDYVGVEGQLFRTKTNELTIWALALAVPGQVLRPLPEKWHGLTDVEIRYRQRYLDLIVNPESRAGVRGAQPRSLRGDPRVPGRARLPRGRDADDAADRRRRAGAAVRHASQRARHASCTCASRRSCI